MAVGDGRDDGDLGAGGATTVPPAARDAAAARTPQRCGGERLAAEVLPAGDYGGGGGAAGLADGGQHAAVGRAGRGGGSGAALRRAGLDTAQRPEKADGKIPARAPGGEPSAASAVVNAEPAVGLFAVVYAAGPASRAAWRSARPLAAAAPAGKPELFSDQYRP